MATSSSTSKRGFASMDGDRQREIASKGGKKRSGQRNGRFLRIGNWHPRRDERAGKRPARTARHKNNADKGAAGRPLYFCPW